MGFKSEVAASVREHLGWLQQRDFRYYRSYSHFRLATEGVVSYVRIDVHSHAQDRRSVGFGFGVRHDAVERIALLALGERPSLSHHHWSIAVRSANVGPGLSPWDHPVWGAWEVGSPDDLGGPIGDEITSFVSEVTLPAIDRYRDALTLRDALVDDPRLSTAYDVWRYVLAADVLLDPRRFDSDARVMAAYASTKVPRIQDAYARYEAAARALLARRSKH